MADLSNLTHSIAQSEKFTCTECLKSFKKKGKLNRHINEIHLNLKEFCCDVCQKAFKRSSHLKRHVLIHSTDPKPFKCFYTECLLRFSDKYHLERHIKVKHQKYKIQLRKLWFIF